MFPLTSPENKKTLLLLVVGFLLGSFLTYEITTNYTQREYEKIVEQQRETISSLEKSVTVLKTEKEKVKTVVIEKFDPNTGKLVLREERKERETKTKDKTTEEVKTITVVKEIEKIVEKEKLVKEIQKNHLYGGVGLDGEGDRLGAFGYQRTVGIFNVGVQVQSDQGFRDKAILGTFGISF